MSTACTRLTDAYGRHISADFERPMRFSQWFMSATPSSLWIYPHISVCVLLPSMLRMHRISTIIANSGSIYEAIVTNVSGKRFTSF